jgi:hypothetical protein
MLLAGNRKKAYNLKIDISEVTLGKKTTNHPAISA